ncbi:MAG: amidophosphoribosyltransferase [Magnetococcales bacterium]|nr:amidophosphoribosyltransferase [Magnetococcales bacterium]MBF0157526.1 amidophosphoribosyltransferase [Magnetococcales bacterium]
MILPDDDHFHDECGVFGVYAHPEAANLVYLGLYALQHRGQESAGIVSVEERYMHMSRGRGLVADVFKPGDIERLKGSSAIGHVRYSTAGDKGNTRNLQPLVVDTAHGGMAIAHNGNLVNAVELRRALEARGSIFQSTMDTEVVVHLTALSRHAHFAERLVEALHQVQGAYALIAMNQSRLIGVRDPAGFRPMVLGRVGNGGYVLSSETCALDLIGATFLRDVEPGELVVIGPDGITSYFPFSPGGPTRQVAKRNLCVFEYIYFARPDSTLDGISVYDARKRIGSCLAKEHPVEAEVVVPVPDSGVPSALGFSQESGIPFEFGIIRNHYVGRTFIEPQQSIRHFGVKIKLNANNRVLQGKRVVLVDDSVVRGTTSRKIVKMVRAAGAREVHVRIASPPTTHPCFYGIDTPNRQELLASNHTVEEMRQYITADSLAFLSLEGLYRAVNGRVGGYCDACFTGNYPIPFPQDRRPVQLTLLKGA